MQPCLCTTLPKSLRMRRTLCTRRIEKIQPPLVSPPNTPFSEARYLQKSGQIDCLLNTSNANRLISLRFESIEKHDIKYR